MVSKTNPTARTTDIIRRVTSETHDKQLQAVITGMVNAHELDGVTYLAFAHEHIGCQAMDRLEELTRILGPVRVEILGFLSEGLKLGGQVREWEELS